MLSPWEFEAGLRPWAGLPLPGITAATAAHRLLRWGFCFPAFGCRGCAPEAVTDSSRARGSEPSAHPRDRRDEQFGFEAEKKEGEAGGDGGVIWAVTEDA